MSVRMLIDASHPEETRVAVVHGNRVEEFDFESATKKQLKGNIYLAKVTRVEPSLQAAFVEYGGNRHGFLAFSEIHPDYYQIPVADRQALLAEDAAAHRDFDEMDGDQDDTDHHDADDEDREAGHDGDNHRDRAVEHLETDDDLTEKMRNRPRLIKRHYKIQEVIKRRQILLVQVVKEERGNKGAALTTYLSLAGRYCVLMPNTLHGGGVSRKIANPADRKKLKSVLSELKMVEGMATIIRTAGLSRTKTEIKRDFDYLTRLWEGIRDLTMRSMAPALIHEEGDLIKRSIRDLYSRDIDEILVEGEESYKAAKQFMRLLMPSHAKKVQHYKDRIPLFHKFQVEGQLDSMFSPEVRLKSGGYIVINPTEALVAIDVNSGRATREHHIEETAFKTNLEAAEEVGRQLRLRDMAGLIVIDFIDMEDRNNVRAVERKLKDCLKSDRARIQVGHISAFGLMEMSRQRLRPGMLEASTQICHICNGTGSVRSIESSALHALRAVEEEGIRARSSAVHVRVAPDVAIYILNKKRAEIISMERRYGFRIEILADSSLIAPAVEIDREGTGPDPELAAEYVDDGRAIGIEAELPEDLEEEEEEEAEEAAEEVQAETPATERARPAAAAAEGEAGEERPRRKRRRRRKRGGAAGAEQLQGQPATEGEEAEARAEGEEGEEGGAEAAAIPRPIPAEGEEGEGGARKRRRRGRRGGRKRSRTDGEGQELGGEQRAETEGEPREFLPADLAAVAEIAATPAEPLAEEVTEAKAKAKPRSRKPKVAKAEEIAAEPEVAAPEEVAGIKAEEAPVKKAARGRKKAVEAPAAETEAPAAEAEAEKPKAKRPARAKKAAAATLAQPEEPAKAETVAPEATGTPAPTGTAETTGGGEEEPQGPRRKGWWQKTFGA